MGDYHVQFCERLKVKFILPTRPKWMCKYHIIFIPKYRRKVIYNQIKADIRNILKDLCNYKGVEIIEGHLMPDHVHMLVSMPPKMSV